MRFTDSPYEDFMTVSYTHLDVYKRQVPDRVNTSDMAAITVSIALFATSAPASTEVGFMVASPFFKILYVIACFWGLALQLVVMGDGGNCAGFILVVDDKGTIVWRLLIVSG